MQSDARPTTVLQRPASWPPDAALDAHPVGTWLLAMGFDLWMETFYRREVLFPHDFRIAPGTLIASNHQRDSDGPMVGTTVVRRHGLHFQWPLPFFATREDLFRTGILARLAMHWPKPLPSLLAHIPLGWFFRLGRAEPIRRVREFTTGEALQALCDAGCSDVDCRSILNARGLRELRASGSLPLHQVLVESDPRAREQWWGLRRLQSGAIERIAPAFRAAVRQHLAHFTVRLDRGRCVYFAPEGGISMDGHFGRIRNGVFRLVHATREPPWILPIALGYDALAAGRPRVVVRVGERFRADPALDRRAFDATLRRSILSLVPVTPSHLLARYLLHGPATFSSTALGDWLSRSVAALHAAGASLDPEWGRTPPAIMAAQRLRWLARKHMVARDGGGFGNTCPRDAEPGWRAPANIVRYLDNSLGDLVPNVAHTLPC